MSQMIQLEDSVPADAKSPPTVACVIHGVNMRCIDLLQRRKELSSSGQDNLLVQVEFQKRQYTLASLPLAMI